MPVLDATIQISANGGDEAAAQLGEVAGSINNIGAAQEGTRNVFGKGVEMAGVRVLSHELGGVTTAMTGVAGATRIMHPLVHAAAMAMGEFALPIIAVTSLAAVLFTMYEHTEKLAEADHKLLTAHDAVIESFRKATQDGAHLTEAQQVYLESLKAITAMEREHVKLADEEKLKVEERAAATGTLTERIKDMFGREATAGPATLAFTEAQKKHALEANRLRAEIEALNHGYATVQEYLDALGTKTGSVTGKMQDQAKALHENADLAVKMTQDQRKSEAGGVKGDAKWVAERAEIKAWEVQQVNSVKIASNAMATYSAVHAAASARLAAVDRKQAEEYKQQWLTALGPVMAASEAFGVALEKSVGHGVKAAGAAFTAFRDAAITAMEQMLAKAIVMGVAFEALGMGGGFGGGFMKALGFQFGTSRVPGPEGAPRLAVVHGGEAVTSPTGMGGPTGGGRVSHQTININAGAFVGTRDLQRFQARMVGSAGEVAAV